MKPLATSLIHRVLPPEESTASLHPAILMLHGRGSDEEDLLGIVPSLDRRFLIVSARAPNPFPYGGYTWYDVGEVGTPEPTMFRNSYEKLVTFMTDILKGYPIDPRRLILFGFSMGTVMSFSLALTHPDKIRGVAGNSGYVPEGTFLEYRWKEMATTDILITHGVQDTVIPISMARRARELFAGSNSPVSYHEYNAAHHLTDESLSDIVSWTGRFLLE
jgi:phospholipase/carboxylesterase